jgi:alcohol dehydrogenase YqhD (iron-dependent ADH family)
VYLLFGDGKPRKKPRAAAAKKIKDNGIDIIAWKRSIDNLPCMLYLIAQVASGEDWETKSVIPNRRHFHKYWFTSQPASQPHDAMFMPFGLEPEDPDDGTPYEEVLTDYMQSIGYEFGTLFYRDRIAKHLAEGLQLVANGEDKIERVKDLAKIVKWVETYTERLRAA